MKTSKADRGTSRQRRSGGSRKTARGDRSILTKGFAPDVTRKVELLMFLRKAAHEGTVERPLPGKAPQLEELWDSALAEFLDEYAAGARIPLPAARKGQPTKSFWVATTLAKKCEAVARAQGVRTARVIDAAISQYVNRRVTPQVQRLVEAIGERAKTALKVSETAGG